MDYQTKPVQSTNKSKWDQSSFVVTGGQHSHALVRHVYAKTEPEDYPDHEDFFILQPKILKELILEKEMKVKIAPTLLIVSGLPDSKKTTAVTRMFKKIYGPSSIEAALPQSQEELGIGFYSLLAARNPIKRNIVFATKENNQGYPSVVYSGVEHIIRSTGRSLRNASLRIFPDSDFDRKELNDQFRDIIESLQHHSEKKEVTEWDRSHSSGLALINVWDVGLNKVPAYILHRLSGFLYNSHVWMFLDLLRDSYNLYKAPDIPENRIKTARNDKELIMKWRSRIRYLLRFAKLAKNKNEDEKPIHQKECAIIATLRQQAYSSADQANAMTKVSKTVEIVAKQMDVSDLIDTQNIRLFKSFNHETDDIFVDLLEKIIHKGLNYPIDVPLSFVLLRSMFYEKEDTLYISKENLRKISEELKITSQSFEDFCRLFTSFGSIIDMSLIDSTNDTIILKPVEFLNKLDKLFYYKGDDPLVTQYGIVGESTVKNIFGVNGDVFMAFLESLNFTIKISPTNSNIDFSDKFAYFAPDICTKPPDLQCIPKSLHFIYEMSLPLTHLKVLFASEFLLKRNIAKLESSCKDSLGIEVNITRFRSKSDDIIFELVFLGDAIEFRFVDIDTNQFVCREIIKACHKIMKDIKAKYNFAVMCSNQDRDQSVCLSSNRHLLPLTSDCKTCTNGPSSVNLWNIALKEDIVPKDRRLNGEYLSIDDAAKVSRALENISHQGLLAVNSHCGNPLNDKISEDKKDWRFFMKMIFAWEERHNPTDRQDSSKRELAKLLNAASEQCHRDHEILKELARSLDLKVDFERK